ncbi:Eor-2p [Parelaphostrongylus tenuis]|uniref:Eor-2p n=1 Tax=Parelaphostrongylus tenuis TaxID=148309 RepID=A0AAD5R5M9_PARTN|nr:Eor-2p [Parelaphostrongylus tenuis]
MGLFGGPSTSSALTVPILSPFITSQTSTPSTSKRKSDSVKPIAAPSPSSFKKEPLVTRPVQKCNKIPVYKQRKFAAVVSNDTSETKDANDAYSFEDDEEISGLGHVDPKEKLDAEVREKLSKITGQHPEMRNKNVYVPGIGFAIPAEQQQDLWRHVVPKKRPTAENRPVIPAANLLPASIHAEASHAAARLAEPEIVTLAESIRRRKKERLACTFIKTEQTYGSDCAKEEGADRRAEEIKKELETQPRLPKLIIKLPRRPTDNSYESKKRKKKRKKKEYDSDWEGSDRTRRKKRTKRDKGYSGYEVRVVERDQEECKMPRIDEERIDVSMLSRKRRLMMQWQEGQESQNRENGEHKTSIPSLSTRSRNEFNTEAVKARLSKFGPADGHLPKGTFVVCKADIFRDDCALWRVDNQNMIQKYPPRIDPATKDISYKNSSTYSGWCDQVAYGYYRIAIKHIKQTRSEAIIRPEIPISDLFPAMASECSDANGFVKGDEESSTDAEDHVSMLREPLRLSLYTFTLAMINHALTLEFFQQMKGKNDWNFLRAVTEIDKVNADSLAKLKGLVKFNEKLEDAIHSYTQLCITDSDFHSLQCQCCSLRPIERIIQLYVLDSYDPETLQSVDKPSSDSSPLPAYEFLVCLSCANVSQLYHRCYHMKYHLLKKCEDKLEILGTQHPEFSPEKTVEAARRCRGWLNRTLTEYMDLWKKIQNLDH